MLSSRSHTNSNIYSNTHSYWHVCQLAKSVILTQMRASYDSVSVAYSAFSSIKLPLSTR
jgi:hypothetical protein